MQPERERCSRREWCSRRRRFNRRQRGSRRQRCSRRQRGSCESSAATESGALREQTRAAERNQSGPRRDMIADSGWDSRAAERPDEECCQGRAEVREGERHQQGQAGATQAKEAAPIRRGRRCHERGEVACYVPDIMSCPRHDVAPNYTKLHRRLMCVRPCGEVAGPRKATARVRVTFQIGDRSGPFNCFNNKTFGTLSTRTQEPHYLDGPHAFEDRTW